MLNSHTGMKAVLWLSASPCPLLAVWRMHFSFPMLAPNAIDKTARENAGKEEEGH